MTPSVRSALSTPLRRVSGSQLRRRQSPGVLIDTRNTDMVTLDIFNIGRPKDPQQRTAAGSADDQRGVQLSINFWDGRADNNFNCLNMHGIKDLNAFFYFNAGGTLIHDLVAGPGDSSLASQAVAPPNSAPPTRWPGPDGPCRTSAARFSG